MALGDGSAWDETTPTDATLAVQIDDYNRELRIGVRGRLAREHEWPSSQAATSEAGVHKFITLQNQAAKPTVSGTQIAALYTKTVGSGLQELFYENEAGTEVQISNRGVISAAGTGAVLQTVSAITTTAISISSTIPIDTSIPQTSEGTAIMSRAITPVGGTNPIEIVGIAHVAPNADGDHSILALFVGTTANAIYTLITRHSDASRAKVIPYHHILTAGLGTTAASTIYLRIGKRAGDGNATLNSFDSTVPFGSSLVTNIIVRELQA